LFSFQEFFFHVLRDPVATSSSWFERGTPARPLCSPFSACDLRHPRDFKPTTFPKGNLVSRIMLYRDHGERGLQTTCGVFVCLPVGAFDCFPVHLIASSCA
ncbi:unnamed protein product, partial [Laminaria digitata]